MLILTLFFTAIILPSELITNTIQTDGFGSQFQNILSAAIYAELNGKKFVYTPFEEMEHNYFNEENFVQKKELLINFIGNFNIALKDSYTCSNSKNFFDNNINRCAESESLKYIKKLFRQNKAYTDYFDPNYLNIAIHIRRPNKDDNRISGANIPDSYFLEVIDKLREIYKPMKLLIHIYSQGDIKNFKLFKSRDTILHIDESVEDTFASMVFADILVTCASSFSYTAGLLSNGIIYYIPFWHKPLPHWINLKNTSF